MDERTLLLILPDLKEAYPLSPAALHQAQGSRRKLAKDYPGALILDRDGTLRRVERVEVLRPRGETFARRAVSRLFDVWSTTTHLSDPLPWRLEEVQQLLAEAVRANGYSDFDELEAPQREEIANAILAAPTIEELFTVLKVPPPEEALDLL